MAIRFRSAELGSAILVASLGFADAGFAGDGNGADQGAGARSLVGPARAPGSDSGPANAADDEAVGVLVRRYRDAAAALTALDLEIDRLNAALAELRHSRPIAEIQADIDALDPAAFESDGAYIAALIKLEIEKLGAPSGSDLADRLAATEAEITQRQAEIRRREADRDAAWDQLTGDRDLTDEALSILKQKLATE